MAKKTTVVLVDDIDGIEIENGKGETVFFALDGISYEIDLTDANASALRAAVQRYVDAGRRTARGTRPGLATGRTARTSSKEDLGAAREWLRAKGHKVSDRGRIPAVLLEEYRASN
ncbi:Lsr2 family protein [Humibacter sp. RRB41]|uniref:histone-like nucleoid-structuring protein Lsr2 n=1 Tax=Humibacter sp. RRB41 TaxID=2919946 RepID=UPI001FAB0012|nr:Lsr2 family protein [Humibacter sp. RRB41]